MSHEPLYNVYFAVEGDNLQSVSGKNGSRKIGSSAEEAVSVPSQYVSEFDWNNFMYTFFEVTGIIFILVKLFVVLVRPFLHSYNKLKLIWIGQTVIYYDLLCYTGLTLGNFRYTIDQSQMGMIRSTRNHFFVDTIIKAEKTNGFMVYKFVQNDFFPKIIQEAPWGVISVVFLSILVQILRLVRARGKKELRILTIAREMNMAVLIFSFVPWVVHSQHNLLAVSYTKEHSFWSILNIIAFTYMGVLYCNQAVRFSQGVRDINYVHSKGFYQKGRVEIEQGLDFMFDCYVSMKTSTCLRSFEMVVLFLLGTTYCAGYTIGLISPIVLTILYFVMMCTTIQLYFKSVVGTNERAIQKRIILLSISFLFVMFSMNIVYCLLAGLTELSLKGVKNLTIIWFVQVFLALAILLGQLIARLTTAFVVPDFVIRRKKYEDQFKAGIPTEQQPINGKKNAAESFSKKKGITSNVSLEKDNRQKSYKVGNDEDEPRANVISESKKKMKD